MASLAAIGHRPVVIAPLGDAGPTRVPLLCIPSAIMLYVTPQSNELTVTIATPLMMGALPEMTAFYTLKINVNSIIFL